MVSLCGNVLFDSPGAYIFVLATRLERTDELGVAPRMVLLQLLKFIGPGFKS